MLIMTTFQPTAIQLSYYFFVAACMAGLIHSTVLMMQSYMSDPTSVQLKTFSPSHMDLPQILICTYTPLNITLLQQSGFNGDEITQLHLHFWEEDIKYLAEKWFQNQTSKLNITSFGNLVKGLKWDEFVIKNGITCTQLFRRCTLHYGTTFDCCAIAQPQIHEKFGLCYIIKKWPLQVESGIVAGARILFNIPAFTQIHSPLIQKGLLMEYGRTLEPPFTTNLNSKINICGNYSISVSFLPRKIVRTSRTCIVSKISAVECFGNAMQQICRCNLLGFSLLNNSFEACAPVHVESCLRASYSNISDIATLCREQNNFPVCEQWNYLVEKQWSSINMENLIFWLKSENYDLSNSPTFAELKLYFGSMEYTVQTEFDLVTFNNLLSQFGGLFGLWLGGSILGLICYLRTALLEKLQVIEETQNEPHHDPADEVNRTADAEEINETLTFSWYNPA